MASATKSDFAARKIRRLVRDIYAKACDRVQVRKADGHTAVSETVSHDRGAMQGDCLSPLIFCIVLAAVLDECDPSTTDEGNGIKGIRIGRALRICAGN
eukprot:COSAG02_NODE_15425_length_1172_cov_2.060578_1_plen_99_part_00